MSSVISCSVSDCESDVSVWTPSVVAGTSGELKRVMRSARRDSECWWKGTG
jgi:hypothetical protein